MLEGQLLRDDATEGLADQHDALESEAIEDLEDLGGVVRHAQPEV